MTRVIKARGWFITGGVIIIMAGFLVFVSQSFYPANASDFSSQSAPTPTIDRLAIPVLPEHPTQIDLGKNVYYYHCMPCHGDKGQGLTTEWRNVWDADHQDCWGRGCHGSENNTSFVLSTVVPPVISEAGNPLFQQAEDLFAYLKATHPPQKPGSLTEDEYWEVTAFLFEENNLLPANGTVGAQTTLTPVLINHWVAVILLITIVAILFISRKIYLDKSA